MSDELRLASVHSDSGAARYVQQIHAGKHVLVGDEPAAVGGGDTGPSPYGLLLAGLAACTATTLRMYAERKTWDIGPIHVDLTITRVADSERIDRKIVLASSVTAEQRAKLAEIAEKTPVTKTLKRGTAIETILT